MERFSVGGRYQPELGKVLNVSYRYNRDSANLPTYNAVGLPDPNALRSIDIAGQWPVWGGWSAVGRYNYSLKDRQPVETLGGVEYNAGCWAVRVVGHQLATASGKANTAVFVQLELTDFARIGSNPLDLLKQNIQGYGLNNQPVADPVFGQ
jgi:LPS-assembly protein